jgi:hypothetical protein
MTPSLKLFEDSADVAVPRDPVGMPQSPDRVFYSLGSLLGVEDFRDEQAYHRGRLARALGALHGGGTVAGLRVDWAKTAPDHPEELRVTPGLGIDRLGRMIDVPRTWCIRVQKWYDAQKPGDLKAAFQAARNAVVADVFIRFDENARGRTPSFASTTFDSINAVSASRLRDAFFIDLIPRRVLSQPDANWSGIAAGANKAALQKAILDAGRELGADFEKDQWKPQAEHEPGIDPTSLLLARVDIPAADANPRPTRQNADVKVDNNIRRFVYPPSLLAQLLGM